MVKNYDYERSIPDLRDEEDVFLEIEYISDGNIGSTDINKPEGEDPSIEDEGRCFIDKAFNLRIAPTYICSAIKNPLAQEDTISLKYKINGQEILTHSNPKSESKDIVINIILSFPKNER